MARKQHFIRQNMFAIGIMVAVVAVLILAALLPKPSANSTTTNREAESADGNGTVVQDTEASNGKALQFGQ